MKKLVIKASPFLLLLLMVLSLEMKADSTSDHNSGCMDCLTAPLLFCPSVYFGCPDDDLNPSFTGTPIALPGDINCPSPLVSYVDTLVIDEPCLKKYHRIWTAQYHPDSASSKLYAQCIQTLYLEDDQAPEINDCPSNLIIQLDESCDSTAVWIEPTAMDNCGSVQLNSNYVPGDTFPSGTSQVLYIAEDACGQLDSCAFEITIQGSCCLNMNIICPPDTSACVNSSLDPSLTGYPIVSMPDSSCIDPLLYYSDSIVSNNPSCVNGLIIERHWYASDSAQTMVFDSCVQTIITEDTIAPQIVNMPDDITVIAGGMNCEALVNWTEPNAIDSCGLLAFDSNISSGSIFLEGVSTVSYAAVDLCGNTAVASFMVTVECDSLCSSYPLITCPPDYFDCPLDSIPDPSVTGFAQASPGDSLCAQPIITFTDSLISTGNCPGEMTLERLWTATDPNDPSLFSTCTQLIVLEDNFPPTISNSPQDITVYGAGPNCLVPAYWTAPNVSDNCGVLSFGPNIPIGSFFSQGTTTIVYTAVDSCGQFATASFNITVECSSSCSSLPAIVCPADYWACPNSTIPDPSVSGYATAYAGSLDCGDPVLSYFDIIISTGPCPLSKVIERHWTATDPNDPSLYSSCIQTINLEDIHAPTILYCPSDITVNSTDPSCSAPVSWNSPLAVDNCGAPNMLATDIYGNTVNNGQIFNQGTTQVFYTATDLCGNTSICQFSVTVQCSNACTEPPTISCPAGQTICPGGSSSPMHTGWAYAQSSSYCPTPVVNYQDLVTSTGPCYGEKTIHRTWTASYSNLPSLSSSCLQIIQLKDDQAPVFTSCPADITVYDSSIQVNWYPAQAIDNCSSVNLTSTHYSGSYFPLGTTQVNYTASDNCWNSSVCSFNVTVLNPYIIDLECPQDQFLTCGINGSVIADWEEPSYSGTCGNCDDPGDIAGFVYMGSLNGSNYYCSTSVADWNSAQQVCQSHGGYLASIGSWEENNFLADLLTLQSAWIGLSDHLVEGDFKWINGEALGYTNWHQGQPNNYNDSQDYVEMLNDGYWNDQYNHFTLEYIMEIPCNNVIQTGGPMPGSQLTGGNYTITYEVQDACGGYGTCSFNIFVDGALSIECPDDIILKADSNGPGVIASWPEPAVATCCSDCPDQSTQGLQNYQYLGSLNGHDYYCSDSSSDWPTAKLLCEQLGGHLAIIETQEENDFLQNLLIVQSAWIGLSDHLVEGDFEWVNGQSLGYSNWYPGQPNNYNNEQDYVEFLNDGFWNDQYNYYSLKYILELPNCIDLVQTGGPAQGSLLPPGSMHTVSYLATDACGNSQSCSFSIEVQTATITTDYCDSKGTNSSDFNIEAVYFGTMVNKSGDDGGYGDYTSICGTISQGNVYEIHLTPSQIGQDIKYWRVWIDYNHDGDFYDLDEMVAYGSGLSTVSGLITVPPFIPSEKTRMRIIMTPGSYPQDPCGDYPLGETEDYCLQTWGTSGVLSPNNIETRISYTSLLTDTQIELSEDEVHIYPNPAVDMLNIELDHKQGISSIQLMDMNGRSLMDWDPEILSKSFTVQLNDLNSGVYIIKIRTISNKSIYKKFIVTK